MLSGVPRQPKAPQRDHREPKVTPKSVQRCILGVFWGEKKAPARDDNQEIGLDPILGVFGGDKKAPARDDHQQIGFEDRYSPWGNPNDKWGRRASPGRETTGVLHGFAVRIQWTTSRTTKLYKKNSRSTAIGRPASISIAYISQRPI